MASEYSADTGFFIVTESSIEQRYCRLFAIIILNFFNSIGIRALEEYFLEIDLLLF